MFPSVGTFHAPRRTARARFAAPEAGALPNSNFGVRAKWRWVQFLGHECPMHPDRLRCGPAQVGSALLRGPRIGATLASRQNKPAPASAALRRARSDAPHPAKNSRTWQKLPGYGTKGLGTPQKHAEMPHIVSEMPRRDAETANLEPILSHGVAEAVTFFAWCAASAPG